MKKHLLSTFIVCGLISLSIGTSHAAPVNAHLTFKFYDFTISNPQGTVQGTFDVTIDDTTGLLSGVSGVNFEISGYHYTDPSKLLIGQTGGNNYITSDVNEWWSLVSGVNDFYFTFGGFNSVGPTYSDLYFKYTTANTGGGYEARRSDALVVELTGSPTNPPGNGTPTNRVPESGATWTILGLSLIGLGVVRRWMN